MTLAKRLWRNTLFNAVGRFWLVGINIVIIPFIISKLGTELYGIWALVLVLTNSYAIFDFGVGAALTKFISQHLALGDSDAVNKVVSSGSLVNLAIGGLICIAVYSSLPFFIVSVFRVPSHIVPDALFAFRISVLIFFLMGIANVFFSVLQGAQRMDISNGIIIGSSIPYLLGIVFVLQSGLGLKGLVINQLVYVLIFLSLLVIAAFHTIKSLHISYRFVSRDTLRTVIAFGGKLQVVSSTSFLMDHLNKIFVSLFVGLSAVTFFDVSIRVVNIVRMLPGVLLSALVPSISEINALDDRERLRLLYLRASKYLIVICVPIVFTAYLVAEPVIKFFLKNEFELAVISVKILALAYGLNLLTGVATVVLRGIGKPEIEMYYALVSAALNIIFVPLLGQLFGYYGLIAGLATASLGGTIYFFFRFHRISKEIFEGIDFELLRNLSISLVPVVIALLLNYGIKTVYPLPPSLALFQPWFMVGLFISLFGIVILSYHYFDAYDKLVFKKLFQLPWNLSISDRG